MITFNIDNVVEYYNEHNQTEWNDIDFPNIAPPFLNFKMKFTMPKYIKVKNAERQLNPLAGTKWQTLWNAYKTTIKGIEGWMYKSIVVSDIEFDFSFEVFCDKNGVLQKVIDLYGKQVSSILLLQKSFNNLSDSGKQGISDTCTTILQPQLLALSFMHCKNVKTEEVNPNLAFPNRVRRHWAKKGREPLENYHIINIYPMTNVKDNPIYQGTKGSNIALTICRGHFKDYRKGKGLFGKYHGIFWIESFVKGAKNELNVDKDYKIKL